LRIEAACIAGRSAIAGARLDEARASFEAAMRDAKRAGDRAALGLALLGLGEADYYAGDRAACAQHYREAERIFRETGKKHDMAQLLWALGYVELEEGRLVAASRMFEEQRAVCRAIRDRLGEANAENALGELARKTGDLKEAEHRYKVAIRIATKSGLSRRWLFRLNLAHTKVAAGEVAAAAHIAAELLDSPLARNEPLIASSCWWIVAHDAALRGDLLAYDKAADAAIAAGDNPFVEEDLAVVAQQAGDAVEQRDAARALRAWEFARAKWRALGRPEEQDA
jgi:tetratricopeptide (TPR) repeat protein